MDNQTKHSRRKVLKIGVTAMAAFRLPGYPTGVCGAKQSHPHGAEFQEQPNGDKQCSNCVNFFPTRISRGITTM